ncbi:hypothetical protein PpBr36_00263 [Pyricularia pennisetigena]|uniref:hypothetical protein n=1 Tax=Pyricularia pennisetigena TaxID=1578925 RepID=UPI00114F0141|nr:hypothetical protein PpBr36_00263 [Pyricularia pennisetigena]TLS28581.1 hypothetical protein PpBr36_00263 [Pyricularia pennisetigena]
MRRWSTPPKGGYLATVMAFSFGNASSALTGASQGAGSGAATGAAGSTTQGPDLELIQTENLGFLSLAGDARVQLTSKWTDQPAPTASLISIASKKGLVAAAGPDAVHIATTESVRKAFQAAKVGDSEVRPFEPQAKLPLPMRISQLAFTCDEQYLIISAESGGGLAVYDVQSVSQGSTQPVMEISTSGESLRTLLPNPNPDMAELVLVVTNNGNLLVANLKQRGLVSGPSGPVMKAGVSSAAWSTKGKQLVAGLADGTLEQLTPDGTSKANIPKPSGLDNHHVASVAWLENNVFLVVHNVTNGDGPSTYNIITRHQEKGSPASYVFQKLTDPVEPFGSEKKPHHTILRLKDFPPDLQDVLLVSSTCREAIGLLTRSKAPLTSTVSAEKITNVFTTTEFADDTKRAELPMGEDYMDTFPIGTALDLSSKDKVYKPIPTDEMDESPGPLPGLWALNNEGVLSVWWIVYNESIRQGTTYPGMAAAQSTNGTATAATPVTTTTSAFGASPTPGPSFGGSSALGAKPSPWGSSAAATPSTAPAFGKTAFGSAGGDSGKSAFGSPAFGSTSALGSTSATPAFGSTSTLGSASAAPAFGQSSALGGGLGAKSSPWATGGTSAASPAFGQSGLGSTGSGGTGKIFGGGTSTPASGGGFSAFANKGGFGSLASGGSGNNSGSIFGAGAPSGSFASTSQDTGMNQTTSFPPPASKTNTGSTPFGSSPFVLGTTFKADPKTANDNEKPTTSSGGSLFGSGFGLSLGDTAKTPATEESKDADMESEISAAVTPAAVEKPTSIFSSTPGSSVFGAPTISGAQGDKPNPFGAPSKQAESSPPAAADKPNPFGPPSEAKASPSAATEKPNPFAGSGNKPGLFGSGTKSIFGSTKPDEPPKSIFSKPDATPASEKKNPFGTFGASTTPSSSPAPSKIFGNTTSTGSIFGNKPAPGGTSSIFGAPTQTSSIFSSVKKPDAAPSTPDKKAAEASLPLPPESTSKTTFTLSESSGSSAASPRIPEHIESSHPQREVTDFTSLPAESPNSELSATPDDAPLPPDPVKEKSKYNMADLKLPPGVVSTDDKPKPLKSGVSSPKFSFKNQGATEQPMPSSDDEDELSEEEEEEEQEGDEDDQGSAPDSEGSGVDVTKDLSPPGYTPQSSFGGPVGGIFSHTPADEPRPGSRLLFGEMSRNAPLFPQPVATSPRSPSPVRGAVPPRVIRSDSVRSVSAPGAGMASSMASSILGRSKGNFGISGMSRQQPGRHTPDPNVEEQRRSQARREADEAQVLHDQEDDWKQDLLNAPPQPTLELAEFTPNTGSAPEAGRTVPAQAEAMYRDINRMVDTLGLNARHLKEYILGHMGKLRAPGTPRKTREDLEIPDDWILCDAEDVGTILDQELRVELEDGRVKNVDEVIEACQELSRGLARLRIKEMDIKKTIMSRIDPSQADALRSLPLSAEQAAQQADLRKQFTSFSKLLAEAEESLTMLRAKMATAGGLDARRNGSVGGAGSGANAVPTVDAVLRTIMKMTSMAEKRSGDVDVLENQLRKLRLQQGLGTANGSRENSPFSTPQKHQHRLSRSVFSPGASTLMGASMALTSSVASYNGSPARSITNSPRKKLSGYSDDDKKQIRARLEKRSAAISKLRDSVEKAGPNVWRMTDED